MFNNKNNLVNLPTAAAGEKNNDNVDFDVINHDKITDTLVQAKDYTSFQKNKTIETDTIKFNNNDKWLLVNPNTTNELRIMIENGKNQKPLSQTTHRLLDMLLAQFHNTGKNNKYIELSFKDYMKKCNLKDKRTARQLILKDLEILKSITIKWYDENDKYPYKIVDICSSYNFPPYAKTIEFEMSDIFYFSMKQAPYMFLPTLIYAFNPTNQPHSYYALKKISTHKSMNFHKPNEDIISVKALLASIPLIPKYEDVKVTGEISRKIITPFENALDTLCDVLTWEYCDKKNNIFDKNKPKDYKTFISLKIKIQWKCYPK